MNFGLEQSRAIIYEIYGVGDEASDAISQEKLICI